MLLNELNTEHRKLHRAFEEAFWLFRMGDHAVKDVMNDAEKARDAFRTDARNLECVRAAISASATSPREVERLRIWEDFFKLYQTPLELMPLKAKIGKLESDIEQKLATAKEGYIDPHTNAFVPASKGAMRMMMRTNHDEAVRKACFDALEKIATLALEEYVVVVGLRNEFARALGFEDYYAYHVHMSEGMAKGQIFKLFSDIYERTKYGLEDIRKLEAKRMPGLRKPWNYNYMMSGSFTLEEDPYFGFADALRRWGRSFAALGIDFRGGTLQLDLLERDGKYKIGFCHYPDLVHFESARRYPGAANFTCSVVYGQPGAGEQGHMTLFHEGGHAADRLASEQEETCLNTEWPPGSNAWQETHSHFMDTMLSSVEWRTRYAKNKEGLPYPLDLFERKVRKLRILAPMSLYGIMFVSEFEKLVYETKDLDAEKVMRIAKDMRRKYMDYSEDSLFALSVPHIYSSDSSAYFHAYGLAFLAIEQWREYFYERYGHIVDNPCVGKEMREVWRLGSHKTFGEFVKVATGKDLSADAYIKDATMDADTYIAGGKERIAGLASVPEWKGPVRLNAVIKMVHGKETVADNSVSFEGMAEKYASWLKAQKRQM